MEFIAGLILLVLIILGIGIIVVVLYKLYCHYNGQNELSSLHAGNSYSSSVSANNTHLEATHRQMTDINNKVDDLRGKYDELRASISEIKRLLNRHELRIDNIEITLNEQQKETVKDVTDDAYTVTGVKTPTDIETRTDADNKSEVGINDENKYGTEIPEIPRTSVEDKIKGVYYTDIPKNTDPPGFLISDLSTEAFDKYFIVEVDRDNGRGRFNLIDNLDVHNILVDNLSAFATSCQVEKEDFDARQVIVTDLGILRLQGDVWVIDRRLHIKIV